MGTFNDITSAIFDVLLAPWGHGVAWLDITIWAVLSGVFALWVYAKVSNQDGIARVKDLIKMHLIEVRLWRDEPRIVLGAFGRILARNGQYVGFSLVPMVVLAAPFMVVLFQLVAHFAFVPHRVGEIALLEAQLEKGQKPTDVDLELPPGVALDAPSVRTADGRVVWRLRMEEPGLHVAKVRLGAVELTKEIAVGDEPMKVPVLRSKSWEALLYPGEATITAGSPFASVRLDYPRRPLPFVPAGEVGVSALFFVISLVAGFALKDVMGVKI